MSSMKNDNWLFGDEIVEFQQWRPQRARLGVGWRSIAGRLVDAGNLPKGEPSEPTVSNLAQSKSPQVY